MDSNILQLSFDYHAVDAIAIFALFKCIGFEGFSIVKEGFDRSEIGMNHKGVHPLFNGILCHNHCKPY